MTKPAIDPDTFIIHTQAQAYLDDWSDSEWKGNSSSIMCELEEQNILSPPEQLWYVVARCYDFAPYAGIVPQFEIPPYRVDFMVTAGDYFVNQCLPAYPDAILMQLVALCPQYVIEIDGFEWHDKTPKQAEDDRRREREITQSGFTVLRYAAREVFRDPRGCVGEVYSLCLNDVKRVTARVTLALK